VWRRMQPRPRPVPLALPVAGDRWARLAAALPTLGPGPEAELLAEARAILDDTFPLLGQPRVLPRPDWTGVPVSHLWAYHLHYFDYGVALAWATRLTDSAAYLERFGALAEAWIAATATGAGPGWEPYPIAVRVRRWLHALLLAGDRVPAERRGRLLGSIATQCAVLERRLERHLGANHLQRDLQALAQAGLVFEGAPAARWRRHWGAFWRLLLAQVLPDGTHFERSPMYHVMALDDFLEAVTWARAGQVTIPAAVLDRLHCMTDALAVLTRPGGALHAFGDSAAGMAAPVPLVLARAKTVLGATVTHGPGLRQLASGGFAAFTSADARERLVLTAAAPSPPHQPAHSHADLLGFELDLDGHRFVVDRGVCGYGGDPHRAYHRGTGAHNTVVIGDRDQSEPWGVFRMGGRAREVRWAAEAGAGDTFQFEGSYRPWHDPGARHARRVTRSASGWRVEDRVEGARGQSLASHLHFAPGVSLEQAEGVVHARVGSTTCRVEGFGGDRVVLHRTGHWQGDAFGPATEAATLTLAVDRNDGRAFGWTLTVGGGP